MIHLGMNGYRIVAAVLIGAVFTGLSWSVEKSVKRKTPTPSPISTPTINQAGPRDVSTPTILISAPTLSPTGSPMISHSTATVNPILSEVQKKMDSSSPKTNSDPTKVLFTRTGGESIWKYAGETSISLALVILLALGLAWGVKRFLIKNKQLGGGYIELMGSYALSPKSQVHLIRVGEEFFLIGEGSNSVSLISQINVSSPQPEAAAVQKIENTADVQLTPTFSERLSQWQNALHNRDFKQEVQASLLLLSGLSKRLHKKGIGEP